MAIELSKSDHDFMLQEYDSLRGEILHHMAMQDRMIELAVAGSAAFITFATSKTVPEEALFALPILLMLLAFAWKQHDLATAHLGRYIREGVEARHPFGWEKFIRRVRSGGFLSMDGLVFLSVRGVFLVTQSLALLIAALRPGGLGRHLMWVSLDAVAIAASLFVLRQVSTRHVKQGATAG